MQRPQQILLLLLAQTFCVSLSSQGLSNLPAEPKQAQEDKDWLLAPSRFKAAIYRSADGKSLVLNNGLIRRELRISPNAATVALDNLMTGESVIRGVKPEARITIDGTKIDVGGLRGQTNYAFLRPESIDALKADPEAMQFVDFTVTTPEEPFAWKRVRHHDRATTWPPQGVALQMRYALPNTVPADTTAKDIEVTVHYELYDGIPCFAKWITVHNKGLHTVTIESFTSEILAAVEPESRVETRPEVPFPKPNLWVETDYATGGSNENGQRWSVHWVTDPDYKSQVNYQRKTPCLLECKPSVGPAQDLEAKGTFRSFKTFVLVHDSDSRSRNGLARCKMYRCIAPWVTENPLMMHVRFSDWKSVKNAIDQCAEVGFEMVILTFGSGFNIENTKPEYLAEMKRYADYAHSKGIEIGGYSLLSSRKIGNGNNVVSPPGEKPAHGNCPALTSEWGQNYYKKLYDFFPATGFSLLEHDGPYPGDFDITARPPLQKGLLDSQWVQFWIAAKYYRWCREQGIYLNTPDWYYLNGSTKSAMGYREVNWSLPRNDQVIHTRQNIFDGTWTKTPTMGWMFVPLTQYQGGGAAATVEPLHEHLDHYRRLLESNLSAGVQACYRGPRIYDTDATRKMLKAQVDWFKRYRRVLESDIDHAASRRPDGRDLDWILHCDPTQTHKGMLVVHNPRQQTVEKTIRVKLYNTGLSEKAHILDGSGKERTLTLNRSYEIVLEVSIPAGSMNWYLITGK